MKYVTNDTYRQSTDIYSTDRNEGQLCNIILRSEAIKYTGLFRTSHAYTNTTILSLLSNLKRMYPLIAAENNIRRSLHLLNSHLPINTG
jgi:hypothetical protein